MHRYHGTCVQLFYTFYFSCNVCLAVGRGLKNLLQILWHSNHVNILKQLCVYRVTQFITSLL